MGLQYPLINGVRHSFASIELTINTEKGPRRIVGFKEIAYSQDLEPGEVRGSHPELLGRTIGDLKNEASVTLYNEEWKDLQDAMGDGYMQKAFDISVTYAHNEEEVNIGVVTDELKGCRIKKIDRSHSQGTDGLEVKLDLHPMRILLNGKEAIKKPIVKVRIN